MTIPVMVPITLRFLYEPKYEKPGWFDDDGLSMASWLDRDLGQGTTANPIVPLFEIDPDFFLDPDTIFQPPPIEVEMFPSFYLDPDTFFVPLAARALTEPDAMLKNEVRRLR